MYLRARFSDDPMKHYLSLLKKHIHTTQFSCLSCFERKYMRPDSKPSQQLPASGLFCFVLFAPTIETVVVIVIINIITMVTVSKY